MPHLTIEYSPNILEKGSLSQLLKNLNSLLSEHLPTDLFSCKSRAIQFETYFIGDGDALNAFVHINLKVLPGRTMDKLTDLGNTMLNILYEFFYESAKQLNLQITVEINELSNRYFKYTSA